RFFIAATPRAYHRIGSAQLPPSSQTFLRVYAIATPCKAKHIKKREQLRILAAGEIKAAFRRKRTYFAVIYIRFQVRPGSDVSFSPPPCSVEHFSFTPFSPRTNDTMISFAVLSDAGICERSTTAFEEAPFFTSREFLGTSAT